MSNKIGFLVSPKIRKISWNVIAKTRLAMHLVYILYILLTVQLSKPFISSNDKILYQHNMYNNKIKNNESFSFMPKDISMFKPFHYRVKKMYENHLKYLLMKYF